MKDAIHPDYQVVTATCSCGNELKIGTTRKTDMHLDVCSQCHPFYTGKQKMGGSGGRIDRFKQRFGNRTVAKS